MTGQHRIRIGGASGFWGDAALATSQLLAAAGELDYLVYDYLAEVTMSIMARARSLDSSKGYATDFISAAMGPNLSSIAQQGVKVVSNAGGVNPEACAEALRALLREQNLQLSVAVVLGDDLSGRAAEFGAAREMFSDEPFPDPERVASINAYLGAFPIAAALNAGADIVVTGRCVDSAVTLGACIHAFGWRRDEGDKLAQGSLAGHILECGTQATGGNYTDWASVAHDLHEAGYPIAEVRADGRFRVSKPPGTGGAVTVGTVGEQMLYEIGDPGAYLLPDVVCDFTGVELEQSGADQVEVRGAKGRGIPESYKVSATWADGFRAGQIWTMYGRDAPTKARLFADSVIRRCEAVLAEHGLPPLLETSVEILGVESHFGDAAQPLPTREVDVKMAVKHASPKGVAVFLKEMVGMALTAPPGLAGFAGARPKPTPVVRLFSLLLDKNQVPVRVELDGDPVAYPQDETTSPFAPAIRPVITVPAVPDDPVHVPLDALAFGRSGDKGDKANIGILARHSEFLPWIAATLTEQFVAEYFCHFLAPNQMQPVHCFYLPGTHALNFLLHQVLGGGGVASLRSDPQGKGYAQLLLCEAITVPRALAEAHSLPLTHTTQG